MKENQAQKKKEPNQFNFRDIFSVIPRALQCVSVFTNISEMCIYEVHEQYSIYNYLPSAILKVCI